MFTVIKKLLFFSACLLVLMALPGIVGCGGGGSGSTMSPDELEVATVIDSFSAAIVAENDSQAMTYVDTTIKYYGGAKDSDILGYDQFKARLQNFFAAVSSVKFEVTGLGITLSSETTASARGLMVLDYSNSGIPQNLTENIEVKLEKSGKNWGIVEFARYGTNGTARTQFPPYF